MDKRERRERYHYGERGLEVCEECRHFVQHYVKFEERECGRIRSTYMKVFDGHCTTPQCKNRRPWDTCARFEKKE